MDTPDDCTSALDSMTPLAQKLSHILAESTEPRPGPNQQQIKLILLCYYDPIARPQNPPSPFDPIEVDLWDGVSVKLGRPVRGESLATEQLLQIRPEPSPIETQLGANSDNSSPLKDESDVLPPFHRKSTVVTRPSSLLIAPSEKITKNVWFKSKVVSRTHSELWMKNGQIYIKDSGSSSGSFLNGMRLSPAGKQSRPYPLRDGDVIQLGIDYQGRQEDIFKAIVAKVVIQSSHPGALTNSSNGVRFRKALQSLLMASNPFASGKAEQRERESASVDCCICLSGIGPFQALFLSPCSHCFHFKCVRNILNDSGLMFPCPVCRQVANLEASVSMESLCDTFDEVDESSTSSKNDIEMTRQNPFHVTLQNQEKIEVPEEETPNSKVTDAQQNPGNVSGNTLPSEF